MTLLLVLTEIDAVEVSFILETVCYAILLRLSSLEIRNIVIYSIHTDCCPRLKVELCNYNNSIETQLDIIAVFGFMCQK